MIELINVISELGWSAGALAVMSSALVAFVWRDWSRIQRLEARVEALETEIRVKMGGVLTRMEQALNESTAQLRTSSKVIENFLLRK